jgi:aminoglycoside phosphotransferase (APT) family kinase protein
MFNSRLNTETPVTRATLVRLAARHGLTIRCHVPCPWVGATSRVFDLGDVVVKVPHGESAAIASLLTDVWVSVVARNLGVRVAPIVAFEDANDLLPVPYAIFERIPGRSIAETGRDSREAMSSWEGVGRQLAILHAIVESDVPDVRFNSLRRFRQTPEVDPRPWVDELTVAGMIDRTDEVQWTRLLERLASSALHPIPLRLCHGDVNAANVIISPAVSSAATLIDWAGAGWLDPVWDLAAGPLSAVPYLLRGHRSFGPLPTDETAEARILWCRLQVALNTARQREGADGSSGARLKQVLVESLAFEAEGSIG